jgi:hypothetical protein
MVYCGLFPTDADDYQVRVNTQTTTPFCGFVVLSWFVVLMHGRVVN